MRRPLLFLLCLSVLPAAPAAHAGRSPASGGTYSYDGYCVYNRAFMPRVPDEGEPPGEALRPSPGTEHGEVHGRVLLKSTTAGELVTATLTCRVYRMHWPTRTDVLVDSVSATGTGYVVAAKLNELWRGEDDWMHVCIEVAYPDGSTSGEYCEPPIGS
ncbi:MAG TPA: hypothetical protein VNA20_08555 [Frankiaceae bacterium]|nr:hypothetical protein [Frankiaceae bacterium]